MSYGPAGYEDDWDDNEFDFGDSYDTEYSTDNFHPGNKSNENEVKPHEVANANSTFTNPRLSGGFGSPSDFKSLGRGSSGGALGKFGGFGYGKGHNSVQSKKGVPSKKSKGQGNFLFTRSKDTAL